MDFKYLAINGDNVGDSIGNAIATDNHEELSGITGKLKEAHGGIDEWVESVGGEIVTSSGDEGIYKLPAESLEESKIEEIRQKYSELTGTTVTIGIGSSMSEASKALIYGKLNEKDQVVEYSQEMDDFISSHGEEEQVVDEEVEEPIEDESIEHIEGDDQTPSTEIDPEKIEDIQGEEEVDEMAGEETLMEEGEEYEEDLNQDPEEKIQDVVGEDLDGDGDLDTMPAQDDPLAEDQNKQETLHDDVLPEEEAPLEEAGEERQGAISDMIHANMEGEEEEQDDEGLKESIINSLMIFKQNKEMLEMSQQQNPELYNGIMSMLSSMIEMAKKLNMNPEADMHNQEMEGELPHSEEMSEDIVDDTEEEMDEEIKEEGEDTEEEDDEEQKDFENQFKKSEEKLYKFYKDVAKNLQNIKGKLKEKK